MTRHLLPALSLILLATAVAARAQEPCDDPGWQSRCTNLQSHMLDIDKGSAPPDLLQTTQGAAGEKFAAIGRERSAANQHYVACTLFFTAAMAERQANSGKLSTSRAHNDVILGYAEMKLGEGKSLGFMEKMIRTEEKVLALKDPAISPADLVLITTAFGPPTPGGPMPGGVGAPVGVDPVLAGVGAGSPVAGVPAVPAGVNPALAGAGAALPVAGAPGAPVGVDPALAGGAVAAAGPGAPTVAAGATTPGAPGVASSGTAATSRLHGSRMTAKTRTAAVAASTPAPVAPVVASYPGTATAATPRPAVPPVRTYPAAAIHPPHPAPVMPAPRAAVKPSVTKPAPTTTTTH